MSAGGTEEAAGVLPGQLRSPRAAPARGLPAEWQVRAGCPGPRRPRRSVPSPPADGEYSSDAAVSPWLRSASVATSADAADHSAPGHMRWPVASLLSYPVSPRPAYKRDCASASQPAAAGHLSSFRSPAGASSIASRTSVGFAPSHTSRCAGLQDAAIPPICGTFPPPRHGRDGAIGSARKGLAALAPWPLRLWQRMWGQARG